MRNTTQKELAEKLGVSEVTLSRASNGNTSLPLLEKIANVLDIEVSELFAPSENKDDASLTCPHCGKKINIRIEKGE